MKNKIKVYKDSMIIIDKDVTTIPSRRVLYGREMERDLEMKKAWSEDDIQEALERFLNGDFGIDIEGSVATSKKNYSNKEGNLLGVYSAKDPQYADDRSYELYIYYNDEQENIYILSAYEYGHVVPEGWLLGEEKVPQKTSYIEKGMQLTESQRKALRRQYPKNAAELTEEEIKEIENKVKENIEKQFGTLEEKEFEKIFSSEIKKAIDKASKMKKESIFSSIPIAIYHAGSVQLSNIETTKKALEREFTEEEINVLKDIADKHDMTYDEIVELVAIENVVNKKNLRKSYESVIKNSEKPYFFVRDEKEDEDEEDEIDFKAIFAETDREWAEKEKREAETLEYGEYVLEIENLTKFGDLKRALENAKSKEQLNIIIEHIDELYDDEEISDRAFEELMKIYDKISIKDCGKLTLDSYKKPLWVDELLLDQICERDCRIDSESKLCEKLVELGSTDTKFNAIFVSDWVKKTNNKYNFE